MVRVMVVRAHAVTPAGAAGVVAVFSAGTKPMAVAPSITPPIAQSAPATGEPWSRRRRVVNDLYVAQMHHFYAAGANERG